jgi:hypothetical protein
MLTNRTARALLLAEATAFGLAASIHFGAFLDGDAHRRAGIAETVISAALLSGAALTLGASRDRTRRVFVGAQTFATLGVCVGLFTIAIGVGPRTAPDVIYHAAIVTTLIAGLAYARRAGAPR